MDVASILPASNEALSGRIMALLDETGQAVREWQREQDAKTRSEAPRFTVFDFLRTDELGLSDVIRWMLDPAETHGQGDDFLKLFIQQFKLRDGFDTSRAIVRTEVSTADRRRLDVKITCGRNAIAIENKPWAGWQSGQAQSYLDHLQADHKLHCLVVLKGQAGHLPSEQLPAEVRRLLIEQGRLVDEDYDCLADWASACAAACEPPAVKAAIKDFEKFIRKAFASEGDMVEGRMIAEQLRGNRSRVEAALRMADARSFIVEDVFRLLFAAVEQAAGTRGWSVSAEEHKSLSFEKGARPINIRRPKSPYVFVFDANEGHGDAPYVGAYWPGSKARPIAMLRNALEARWPGNTSTDAGEWIWWAYLRASDLGIARSDDPPAVWGALADSNVMAGKVMRWADTVFSVIDANLGSGPMDA